MMKQILLTAFLAVSFSSFAQVAIGTTTPAPSAVLDLTSTNQALLLTRVANTAAVIAPVNGMVVYDISSNCDKFYANGAWSNCYGFTTNPSTNDSAVVSGYTCTTASTGTLTAGIPVSGVAQTITAVVTSLGAYALITSSNGVVYVASGTFTILGNNAVVLTAIGTPLMLGNNSFQLNTLPTCSFSRTVLLNPSTNGTANVSSYVCNTASAGTLRAGTPVSGVTQTITATVTTAGTYSISTTANGVTFAGSGTFAGTGAQNVVLTATGTPTTAPAFPHTFPYTLNTTSGCSFNRIVLGVNDVLSTTGRIWMDRNLGASQVATTSSDANSYGHLYQWGRLTDGHQSRSSGLTTTLSSTDVPANANFIRASSSPFDWRSGQNGSLWQGVASGNNNPCPTGYRLPTDAELIAERNSWSSNNAAGAFASPLKLPMAGFRNGSNGSIFDVGVLGSYWSSTVSGSFSVGMNFNSSNAVSSTNHRAVGLSVRCLKN